jgi:demethylmenaquinone methyltransferase/2-methoxy-6-polyprenyl-1,4-benzoquinol methylase
VSKDMATFFDNLAPKWDNSPSEHETREKLVSMMGISPGSVIADIGCGKGVMFEHLLKTDPVKILAVDVSGEMLRLAKELFHDERIEYINTDFTKTDLPSLDVAVLFNSYPHFIDKKGLAEKLAQTIKTDGIMIIAHSMSKDKINGFHTGENVSKLSTCLECAENESNKFLEYFSPDTLIDNDEIYFIKMIRK